MMHRSITLGEIRCRTLTYASDAAQSLALTYDADGNRLTQSGFSNGSSANATFSVAGSSNQLSSVTGALSRTYSYDAAGHTAAYSGVSFTYNAAGRLLTAVNGSATSSYIYNALGQRVQKTTAAGSTVFLYDESGHLLGEYDGTGNAIQEIVWLGDIPVATVRQEACGLSIFYIHTDHLNTPRRITRRSTSDVVWSWDSDPFGTAGPNENPSGRDRFRSICVSRGSMLMWKPGSTTTRDQYGKRTANRIVNPCGCQCERRE
jgi:YD repeat-containing protein